MSQNVTGPDYQAAGTDPGLAYVKKIPDTDNVEIIGNPTHRYLQAHITEVKGITLSGATTSRDIDALTDNTSTGYFLRIDGANAMTANMDLGTHDINNADQINATEFKGTTLTGTATSRNINILTDNTSTAHFLRLDGTNAMTADMDLGTHDINNATQVNAVEFKGTTLTGTSTSRNINTLTDNASTAHFLRIDGTNAMTADLNMNTHNLTDVGRLTMVDIASNTPGLFINGTGGGSADNTSIAIGPTFDFPASVTAAATVAMGGSAVASAAGGIAVGYEAQATALRGVAIGQQATATQPNAVSLGYGAVNNVQDTVLLGPPNCASWRPQNNGICNLGAPAQNATFNVLYANGVDAQATLALGGSSATAVDIGTTTTTTRILGKGLVKTIRPIMSGGFSQTVTVTIANTTTETQITGAGVGSTLAPANTLTVGQTLHSAGAGVVSITGGTNTVTLRVYGGALGTTLLATFPITLQSLLGATNAWRLDTIGVVRALGGAGVATIYLDSFFMVSDDNPTSYVNQTTNTTTFDTTVNNIIRVTAQWGAAHASNVFTTHMFCSHDIYS